jgi:large conductance mechanosensitive channel
MSEKKNPVAEFKDFVLQGNVVDLAVAVIIAMFFGAVIKDAVNLILSILAIPGKSNKTFADLHFVIWHGTFNYGLLIQDIITFVIVAAVVFFVVVRPVRTLMEKRRARPDPESTDRACPECLSDIPKAATRCSFCTSQVAPIV